MAEQPKKQSFAPQVSSSTFCLFSEHVHHQNKIQARWADINTPALIPRGVKSHLLFALFFFSSFFFSPTDFNSLFLRYPLPLSHLQMPPLISIQINFIFLGRQYPHSLSHSCPKLEGTLHIFQCSFLPFRCATDSKMHFAFCLMLESLP